jgi:hypothetical protein
MASRTHRKRPKQAVAVEIIEAATVREQAKALSMPRNEALLIRVAEEITDDEILTALKGCLNATDLRCAKDGTTYEVPAHAIRLRTIELIMAYRIGKPLARKGEEEVPPAPASIEKLLESISSSPVMVSTMLELLKDLSEMHQTKPQ